MDARDTADTGHLQGGDTGRLGTGGVRIFTRQSFEHTSEF